MRSAKHLKAITSQVEILEDLKIQLESLLEYVKKIIGKGESWIDDTSNKLTFLQINQLLTSETALCYRKCLSIADGNEESPDLEETEGQHNHDDSQSGVAESSIYKDEFSCRDLKLRLEEVEKLVLGHPNSFSALKRKLKDRDKRNKEIIDTKLKEMTQQMNSRFEECMKELCAASDFMYSLDTETKLLSTHLNQNKLEMLDKLQKQEELNDRISAMEKSDNNDTLSLNELNQKIQEISAACCKTESTTKSLVNRLVEIEKLKYLTEAVETLHKDIGTVTSSAETTKLLNEQIMREFSKNSENLHKKVFLLESQINDIICNRHTLLEQANKAPAESYRQNQRCRPLSGIPAKWNQCCYDMRPAKHLKAITSQVEILEDFKIQLESLLDYVNNVIKEGKTWIEDKENKLTFLEMNQFLISETSKCMITCLNIANDNQESSKFDCYKEEAIKKSTLLAPSLSNLKDDECFKEVNQKLEDMEKSYLKKFEEIKETLTLLEKQNESILKEKTETDKNADKKFEELLTELHSASDYISYLQSQNETVSKSLGESNSNMLKKISDLEGKIENLSKKQTTGLKNEMFDELQSKTQDINKICCDSVSKIENLSAKMIQMENLNLKNLASLFETLKTDVENVKLNVATSKVSTEFIINDHSKTNAEIQRRVTTLEVQTQHFSRDIEELRNQQKDKGTAVGFLATFEEDITNDFEQEERIECYPDTLIDLQNNFNTDTGIFTVPVDGVYLCSLTIDSTKYVQEFWKFEVIQKEKSSQSENTIAETYVRRKDTMATCVGLVHLSKEDQLYVRAAESIKGVELSNYSQFMCVLLKEG